MRTWRAVAGGADAGRRGCRGDRGTDTGQRGGGQQGFDGVTHESPFPRRWKTSTQEWRDSDVP